MKTLAKLAVMAVAVAAASQVHAAFKVVGYFPTWQGDVNALPYNKVTHINYAFLLPTSTGGLQALDGGDSRLSTLTQKAHAAGVKVLISVGGWNNGDDSAFRSLAANSSYRGTFVSNVMNFVNQYGLDGVDIDWEYPEAGSEASNFKLLMQDLSSKLKPQGKLLTAAVTADDSPGSVDSTLINTVDFLNLMVYDLGQPHSTYAQAQSALTTWRYNEGLPVSKMVLGVPFYSHKNWVAYKDIISTYGAGAAQVDNAGGLDYNGQPTIRAKSQLALNEAGGIMFWDISQDSRDATSLMTTIWDVVGSAATTGSGSASRMAIPGTVEVEKYSGYQDTTPGNSGGAYRNDGVDIEASSQNGYNVGWIEAGEWLDINVSVGKAGKYKMESLVASPSAGGKFHVSVNGQTLTNVTASVTGGWQNWQWVSNEVSLPAGDQTLRVTMDQAGFNLNALRFTAVSDSTGTGSYPAWQAGKTYVTGDIVMYNGKAYIALHDNPGYDPVISYWYWGEYNGGGGGGTASPNPAPGRYTLKAVHSGKCLDVDASGTVDGANIQQYSCNGTGAQAFDLTRDSEGYYHVTNANSKKSMDVAASGVADGTNIQQWTTHNGNNQRFSFVDKGNGQYEIRALHSGKCVDVAGQYTTDRANVQQWACNSQSNQRWVLTPSSWSGMATTTSSTATTKAKMLAYLGGISGKQTLVGIENKNAGTPTSDTDRITALAGRVSSFWGGDFGFGSDALANRGTMIAEAKRQFGKGALVSLMYHACSPTRDEYCSWDDIGASRAAKLTDAQFKELVTPGTTLYNAWIKRLDTLSPYFQDLKNNGVVVLFRPFHEMNQCVFWWSCHAGANGSARLYQITHDYLAKTKGFDNIIWVWNVQDFTSLNTDADTYNPGSSYFDIASLDVYNTGYTSNNYNTMLRVSAGKPIAIAECQFMPSAALLSSQNKWIYAMLWPDFISNNSGSIGALYSASNVLTLDEMPGWK